VAPATVTAARALAAAALIRTVVRRKSVQVAHPARALHNQIGFVHDLLRAILGLHPNPDGHPDPPLGGQPDYGSEGVEVGDVISRVHDGVDARPLEQSGHARPLVELDRGPDLQHLASPVGAETCCLGTRGNGIDGGSRRLLVRRSPPVEGQDRTLVLEPDATPAHVGRVDLARELVDPAAPILQPGVELGFRPPRPQQLRPVAAQVGDAADRHHGPGLGRPAPAHAGHKAIAAGDPDEQLPRLLRHVRP
jgi:hypothetical protein